MNVKSILGVFYACMFSLVMVSSVNAAIIFDNGSPTDGPGVIAYGASPPQLTADDFVLQPGTTGLGSVHWWGSLNDDANYFTIRIHDDDGGVPSDVAFTDIFHGPANRQQDTSGLLHRYFFSVSLDALVSLDPGVTYWLQIFNGDTYNGWSWWASDPNSGTHVQQGTLGVWGTFIGDTAFFLTDGATVPLPTAFWLFGSGLIGLIGLARRKA